MDEDDDEHFQYGSPPGSGKWDEEIMRSNDDFEYQDNQGIIDECKELLGTKDFIMETSAGSVVKRFLNAGGVPHEFVDLLADNYHGSAQQVNLLADWLIVAGASVEDVQAAVENQLRDLIVKNFDPKKADSIFSGAGQPPGWIEEMIVHSPWRAMFYKLADKHPDCLMLNFTIKLISDAGFQGEIGAMSSACNQIEVFSKVVKTAVIKYFSQNAASRATVLSDLVKACCNGKHMYLYAQCMLTGVKEALGNTLLGACIGRLSQELNKAVLESGRDVWYLVLIILGCSQYPRVFSSIVSLVERRTLNPGDVTVLYRTYSSTEPPSVEFLRIPVLLDLLTSALFTPEASISADHKPKYIYLLAYAASVYETWDEGRCEAVYKEELKPTIQAIERVHKICCNDIGSSSLQLTADVGVLYQCVRYPVVAMGVLKWVEYCLSEKNYAKVITETAPLQIVLLDEISSSHPLQHELVLNLLKSLFERNYPELDTLVELEFKKTAIDRMLHLMSRGCIMPVVIYVKNCMDAQTTDMSLLRHFLTEVLEMIAPPYSSEFIAAMLPIAKNKEITAPLKVSDGGDDVTEFLAHCENG